MKTTRSVLLALLVSAVVHASDRPPNVVIFLADDLGYADTGAYGNTQIPTPNIDSLAKGGAKFLNGYVSGCVCSPTRAGLMTGRYQQRFGFDANAEGVAQPGDKGPRVLDMAAAIFPQRMKKLGYSTGMIGKWHLGDQPGYLPTDRGFDEFLGILPYGISWKGPDGAPPPLFRGTEKVPSPPNFMNAFCDEALSFLDRHRDKPFFLYLPFTGIHAQQIGAEPWLSRFDPSMPPNRRKYCADVSQLDDIIGRIMEKLRSLGLEEDTLVFFLSDNGGGNPVDNKPFQGTKWTLWEGGIHEPFIVSWKGKIPPGQVLDQPVIQLDILPTSVAAAGGKIEQDWKLDGVNLLPLLEGKSYAVPHEALFWRFGVQYAVRKGDWKLSKTSLDAPLRLFNLATDPGEKDDLAASEPEKVRSLQVLWDEWNKNNEPPRWIDKRWNDGDKH